MEINFALAEESIGYQTVTDPSNTDKRLLIAGSQNMLIDQQKKVITRGGYTRLGPANGSLIPVITAWRWDTSTGLSLPQRYTSDGNLVAWLTTIDGVAINAWTKIAGGFTGKLRPAYQSGLVTPWFDPAEQLDVQPMVQGDNSIYDWSGAVAVVASTTNAGSNNIQVLSGNNVLLASFGGITGTAPFTSATNGALGTALLALLTFSANPTDGQTLILNINGSTQTIHFVAVIGATQGNVLIGANLAATLTHLLGLINAPSSTTANQVAWTGTNLTNMGYLSTQSTNNTVTKAGTTTFGQNRFYNTRNLEFTNVRTGTVFTYLGGLYSNTLYGLGADPTTDIIPGDILVQTIVKQAATPSATRINDVAFVFLNQLILGSYTDNNYYLSKTASYFVFSFSTPRISGEGGLVTADAPCRAINSLGTYLLFFSGSDSVFRGNYQQITVGSTLAETLNIQKFDIGTNKGALNHESVISVGNQIAYLTNETSLRTIDNVQNLTGIDPKTLSQPIQPDFDAEDWTGAVGTWYKNTLLFTAPVANHLYMLNYNQNANGAVERYWNPPQILPIQALMIFDAGDGEALYGSSNSVPETYKLFDGLSDGQYTNMAVTDKIAIHCIAKYAYDNAGKRDQLKTFDLYAVDGDINPNTNDLTLSLEYDYDGYTQVIQETINGTDEDILEGNVSNNSLAQSSQGTQPLGGLINTPSDARRFRVIFEEAREDYFEISAQFETNSVDRYWGILSHGPNASMSPRKPINIQK